MFDEPIQLSDAKYFMEEALGSGLQYDDIAKCSSESLSAPS